MRQPLLRALTKKYTLALVAVLVAKAAAVVAGSYPYDFASYVYQSRSYFEYGLNPLFYWNKGMPLLGIFYSQYALYQFAVRMLTHSLENTVLLHIMYKFVFFACDILTAYVIAKIIQHITGKADLARYGALVWLFNPFILWSVEFQGSYAIIAVLFSCLSLLLFLRGKYVLSTICLALGASVYYYAAIFLPFYAVKRAYEAKRRPITNGVIIVLIFIGTSALCYLPYFFNAQFAHDLYLSLVYHSAPNASQFAQATPLPTYSLLNFPFYIARHYFPTNLNAPGLFKVAGLITLLGILIVAIAALNTVRVYLRKKIYSLYSRHKIYTDERFIYDQLIVVTLFLLLVGNLQDHYLTWVFPYMIICAIAYGRQFLLRTVLLISYTILFIILGTNNVGTYLLDIIPYGTISAFLEQPQPLLALCGFAIMILLAVNIFVTRLKKSRTTESYDWALVPVALCVVIGCISLAAIVIAPSLHKPSILGSDSIEYDFSIVHTKQTQTNDGTSVQPIPIRDGGFTAEMPGDLRPNYYLAPGKSPWYLYSWDGPANDVASVVVDSAKGNSIAFTPKEPVSTQLNFGNYRTVLPVDAYHAYNFSVFVRSNNLPTNEFKASVRFIDQQGNVIPASDITLNPTHKTVDPGWEEYAATFSPPINAFYVEPNLTVSIPQNTAITPGTSVQFRSPALQEVKQYKTITYDHLAAASNNDDVTRYVLSPPTAHYFEYSVFIPKNDLSEDVQHISLNNCTAQDIRFNGELFGYTAQFNSSCYARNGDNKLQYTTVNYTQTPQTLVSLVHTANPVSTVNYHHTIYRDFLAAGVVLTILLLALMIFVWRW